MRSSAKAMQDKSRTGTREWSEHSVNCCRGCSNGCLYCYGRATALRFKWIERGSDWRMEKPRTIEQINASSVYRRKYPGVVMFPTTHDVTGSNWRQCIWALGLLLGAGNRVLLVSKLRTASVTLLPTMRDVYNPPGAALEVRVTITCLDEDLRRLWEPHAPSIAERIEALKYCHEEGLATSVSIEPCLEPWRAAEIVRAVEPYVSGEIWIGKANKLRERTAWCLKSEADGGLRLGEAPGVRDQIERIEAYQTDEAVMRIVGQLQGDLKVSGKIRWKDSYREVIERQGRGERLEVRGEANVQ